MNPAFGGIFCILLSMGIVIYNFIIRSYNLLILLSSSFNSKAKRLVIGRGKTYGIIKKSLQKDDKILWFHCASLGEFEQGLPVMESIKSSYPQYKIFVSFFSPSGYEVQKNNALLDCVFYLPSDSRSNSEKLLNLLNPVAVFFIKYEFWHHYVKACWIRNIPVFSISTILRPDQAFFKLFGGFYRRILIMFSHFFVQNEETMELLKGIEIGNATISRDTRFDRVYTILKKESSLKIIEDFKGTDTLIVLGSTWVPDINLWVPLINQSKKMKFIIAPHHVDSYNIQYIENKIKLNTIRYSRAGNDQGENSVLIIDNIGILSTVYKYAEISYVGGAFNEGLHNILEPATYGKPIIIGKSKTNKKFHEVISLVEEGGAFEVSNSADLGKIMYNLLSDKVFYDHTCNISKEYVKKNLGSTKIIMEHIKSIL
jgi:3-deoxy-D-manno-octulosonic-acid transferase